MRIGLVTDSLAHLPFEEMLDTAAEAGIEDLEFPTGGWSTSPHIDVPKLIADSSARDAFMGAVRERGLGISALNANGNQLHPVTGEEGDGVVRRAVELASLMEVPTVVLMSGLPGGSPGDTTGNWVTTSWPPETQTILDYQWNEVAIPYWKDLAAFAKNKGVKLAVEMHGHQLVYNVGTLHRLRDAVGDTVGANFDPSHPIWMGADPREVARALDGVIYNVHAKDSRYQDHVVRSHGILGTQPPEQYQERPWNYVTLGLGYPGGQALWGQVLWDMRAAGYDGTLAIEHEDMQTDAVEGVIQSVNLLESVILRDPPSWKPQAI